MLTFTAACHTFYAVHRNNTTGFTRRVQRAGGPDRNVKHTTNDVWQ